MAKSARNKMRKRMVGVVVKRSAAERGEVQ
jgi:hypothetical protein